MNVVHAPDQACLSALNAHKNQQEALFKAEGTHLTPLARAWKTGYFNRTPKVGFFRAYNLPNFSSKSNPVFYAKAASALKSSVTGALQDPALVKQVSLLIDEILHDANTLSGPSTAYMSSRFFARDLHGKRVRGVVSLSHRAATFSLIIYPNSGGKPSLAGVEELHMLFTNEAGEENFTYAHVMGVKSAAAKEGSKVISDPDTIAGAHPQATEQFRTRFFPLAEQAAGIGHLTEWLAAETGPRTLIIVPVPPGQALFSVNRLRGEAGAFSDVVVLPMSIVADIKATGLFDGIKNTPTFRNLESRVTMLTKNDNGVMGVSDISPENRVQNPQRAHDAWPAGMSQGAGFNRIPNFNLPLFGDTTVALIDMENSSFRELPTPPAEAPPARPPAPREETPAPDLTPPAPKPDPALAAKNAELTATVEKLTTQIATLEKEKADLDAELTAAKEERQRQAEDLALSLAADELAVKMREIEDLSQSRAELARTLENLRAQLAGLRAHKHGLDQDELLELRRLTAKGMPENLRDTLRYHEILSAGRLIIHDQARKMATHSKWSDDPEVVSLVYRGLRAIYEEVIPVLEKREGRGLQGAEEEVLARCNLEVAFSDRHKTTSNASARRARTYTYTDPLTREVRNGEAWYHVKLGLRRRIYFDIIQDTSGVRRALVFVVPDHLIE